MSLLDRPRPGLSVVFVRYDSQKYGGAWESLASHLETLDCGLKAAVVVDNGNEALEERGLSDWAVEIGGDNSSWEFSAFDRGVDWLMSNGKLFDLTLLVTDAFRAYGDSFLGLVDRQLLTFCRHESAVAGWVDSFMEPCELLGLDYEAWFRTSYLVLPTSVLEHVRPFAWPIPSARVFGSGVDNPWAHDSPLSANLRRRVEQWLLRPADDASRSEGAGAEWHSSFELDEGTFAFFKDKVRAILREHHLSARLLSAGVPAFDFRVLSDLVAKRREPAEDGSDDFFKGLEAWLFRDRAASDSLAERPTDAGGKLVFAGDLAKPDNVAAVRTFASRVMPLILQRYPFATFEVPSHEPPQAIADLVGVNRTFLRAPEWVMDAGGAGVAAVLGVGSSAPVVARARQAERIDLQGLETRGPLTTVASRCCAALGRAELRLVEEPPAQNVALVSPGIPTDTPTAFRTMPLRWRADHSSWLTENAAELQERDDYECSLVTDPESFTLNALCRCCEKETVMHVDFEYGGDAKAARPNWRERVVCQECGLNSKMRGVLHVLEEVVVPGSGPRVLVWDLEDEMMSAARRYFGNATGVLAGRELPALDGAPRFDCMIVIDMFERSADFDESIARSLALLKPGGGIAFSAAFRSDRERIRERPSGKPQEVRRDFGWAMLDRFREGGFEDVVAHLFWDPVFGYLGEHSVFVARKAKSVR